MAANSEGDATWTKGRIVSKISEHPWLKAELYEPCQLCGEPSRIRDYDDSAQWSSEPCQPPEEPTT